LNCFRAASNAFTAARVPGLGGFFGGGGTGTGRNASLRRKRAFRLFAPLLPTPETGEADAALATRATGFVLEATVFLVATFLAGVVLVCLRWALAAFLETVFADFLAAVLVGALFLAGLDVMRPGRCGFLETAFLALLVLSFWEAPERLLVAFVIRLPIVSLVGAILRMNQLRFQILLTPS
jgi:hypothetical protein